MDCNNAREIETWRTLVAPLRGAWIATAGLALYLYLFRAPPLRGAWIETFSVFVNPKVVRVAPRTGRVD